jgi:Family of unknown function (DUF5654)
MQKEVIEKVAALIPAAFGLIAALAWNTAIREIFRLTALSSYRLALLDLLMILKELNLSSRKGRPYYGIVRMSMNQTDCLQSLTAWNGCSGK